MFHSELKKLIAYIYMGIHMCIYYVDTSLQMTTTINALCK